MIVMTNFLKLSGIFFLLVLMVSCGNEESLGKYNLVPDGAQDQNQKYILKMGGDGHPSDVDLRKAANNAFPAAFNQGDINSCTANAVSAAIHYDMVKQGWRDPFVPSRMFIYYEERAISNTLDEAKYGSTGATVSMKNCIKAVHNKGYCSEEVWPYELRHLYTKPSDVAYDSAKHYHTYQHLWLDNDLTHLKDCLASGYPFLFGISVYESFESASTRASGVVPMPAEGEKKLGGHAVLAVGYDDAKQQFIFRNSYGADWGESGYGYMPYEFVTKYGFDFWEVKKVL